MSDPYEVPTGLWASETDLRDHHTDTPAARHVVHVPAEGAASAETRLRELAAKATPGQWNGDASDVVVTTPHGARLLSERVLCEMNRRFPNAGNDAAYVAEASPANVLALLDAKDAEIAALQAEMDRRGAVQQRRHVRLSEAVGMDPGYSVDGTIDGAIKRLAARSATEPAP